MDHRLAPLHDAVRLQRTQEAAALCDSLLEEAPQSVELLSIAASLAYQQGELSRAFDLSARALTVNATLPQLHNNLGVVLHDLGRSEEAISFFDAALAISPGYAEAHCNRGNALRALGRGREAVTAYRAAIAHAPDFAQGYFNLGNALRAEGEWPEAVHCYRKLLALDPQRRDGWLNLCGALMMVGEPEDALHAARRTVRLAPDSIDAHWNLALALLAVGEYREGWQEYQWRLRDQINFPPRFSGIPHWDGSPLAGRTVLLAAEQGLGDAIQFIRYASLLAQTGARVVVECRRELLPLFARQEYVDAAFALGEELPPCDCYAYLMNLPHLFRTEFHSIPAQVPYLQADPALAALWKERLSCGADLKVGVVWAGSAGYRNDRYRSLHAGLLAPLAAVPGVTLYSLQLGKAGQDPARLSLPMVDLSSELKSFADTAAVVSQLDLVISVDTAVAHLAGAMGKPVWLLLPKGAEWRWLSGRDDSPWYPTMRLFRQGSVGGWDEVLQRAAQELSRQCRDVAALFRRGNALANDEKREAAIAAYRRLLEIDPCCAEAYSNLGLALHDEGRLAEAAESYRSALALKALPHAANNLGTVLNELGEREEALGFFRRALELAPDFLPAALNLGSALQYLERPQEALSVYRQALQRHPQSLEARINLGTAYQDLALPHEAVAVYQEALALHPESAEAHWNLSLNLLMAGDYARGWREYEWRLRTGKGNLPPATWDGSPLAGETVVLRCEQGLGDTLHFARYAPLVARAGGRVVMECQTKSLEPLLSRVPGVSAVFTRGDAPPPGEHSVPLLSLPRIFGTTPGNIPTAPYLSADPERQELWRRRLAGDGRFKIGLVWKGGPLPRNRACPYRFFAPLRELRSVACYSLQLGEAPDPSVLPALDLAPEIRDFADTAAIIANLDLVLSIDTAVAHLAGGMGAPTWLLLPHVADWRWLSGRDDSPWYPGMRLFRQERAGDWGGVMERVCAELSPLR